MNARSEPPAAVPAAPAGAAGAEGSAELRGFLELGVAQLDAALRESEGRVENLAAAVSAVVSDARVLAAQMHAVDAGSAECSRESRARIQDIVASLNSHVEDAITSLQFYDKLVQRLTHIREGLAIPSDSSANGAPRTALEREALLEQVRSHYSMVEERVLFDFMMRGLSAEQMLKALESLRAAAASGEFEAF